MSIEGFDEDISSELSARAQNFVKMENQRIDSALKKLKVKNDLYEFSELSKSNILTLAENNIKTLEKIAIKYNASFIAVIDNDEKNKLLNQKFNHNQNKLFVK